MTEVPTMAKTLSPIFKESCDWCVRIANVLRVSLGSWAFSNNSIVVCCGLSQLSPLIF